MLWLEKNISKIVRPVIAAVSINGLTCTGTYHKTPPATSMLRDFMLIERPPILRHVVAKDHRGIHTD